MYQKTILALVSMVALSTGCGVSKSVEALGQIDVPTAPSNPSPPPATPPESKALLLGSNTVPVTSFTQNVQTFYYDFSGISATKLDYYIESVIAGCPADPTATFTLVDYTTGSESVVRDIGRSATIEKPTSTTARMKIVISGLSGCMSYGMSFRIDPI